MTENIKAANISTHGLVFNADSGFDTNEFRTNRFKNTIIENIDFNKINGHLQDHICNELL